MSTPAAAAAASRPAAFLFLALANLFWSGNWVIGRALRDAIDPVSLNFLRWVVAALILAPFALPAVVVHRAAIRRSAGLLLLLSLTGVVLFQVLVYAGLRTTTTVNAVLLNSSAPLFIMLCSWVIERDRATPGQIAGMLISLAGILIIMARGEMAQLAQVRIHAGDAWVLLAMLVWGVYSVLLKRRPPELGGVLLLFLISVAGVLYVAVAASVGAYICWNRGVAVVGANAAGVTLHLLPAFGTILAILLLGETFQGFHAAGITTILVGVVVATRAAPPPVKR